MHASKGFATVEMWIEDGELKVGKAIRKDRCVNDFDTALAKLVNGEVVHVLQTTALVSELQRTLRVALGKGLPTPAACDNIADAAG